MKVPPIITLKVDCPDGGDVSGLIFIMRVTAGTKNPFQICFPKTSADGVASITVKDFRGQFADHYEMGLMDYNGSIEVASDIVGFSLFDPRLMMEHREELSRWPLTMHGREVWRSRQERIDYFLSCCNRKFYFFEQSTLIPEDGNIRLTVEKKLRTTDDPV